MKKITSFDKSVCRALRIELDQVLAKYGAEIGIEFEVGSMSFLESAVNIKIAAKIIGAKTIKEEKTDSGLTLASTLYNLTLEPRNGRQLVGYNKRANQYPFIMTQTGKRWKLTVDQACQYFGIAQNPPVQNTLLTREQIQQRFVSLVTDLSPENLSCDGELSAAKIRKRHAAIMAEWRSLEKQYGSTVSEDQAWKFHSISN